ncbi:peptide/nickel transport system permease protein [Methylohalomonas lacus]|uniref:Peptide/nickel transport system permease protein n=1 Tax=Methylohalomonas lacus TaxID=398773 RepID=A0AAE3HLF8_9GAMM|nr:nickel ABC transporter permease [Methylohalomonas lacus]MCS3903920.1 peptide/nickel transport system permease protein [Methylohalomonas lacus]
MLRYIALRLASSALVIFGVSSVVFLLLHLVPGDPVEVMLGESAGVTDREALREALGLNLPLWQQWLQYMQQLLQFDLGVSLHSKRPIAGLLAERIPVTAVLAGASLLLALLLAVPLGVLAAVYHNRAVDRGAMVFALAGVAIPNFWLGPLLILVFAYWFGWLPVSGMQGPASVILPALTLGTALAALQSRMIRTALLEELGRDYIRAARARGFSPLRVIGRHALGNALLPVTTVLGLQLGALLTGAVVTEQIFNWPGVGQLLIDSIQKRDYPVVQACILFISLTYVSVNLLTDLTYAVLDPRVRLEAE